MKKSLSTAIAVLLGILAVGTLVISWPFSESPNKRGGEFIVDVFEGDAAGAGFAYSSLYSPTEIKATDVTSSSITIIWNFEERNLKVKPGLDPKYAEFSGFRIYRDGFWLTDVPENQTSITDKDLFPGEPYKYKVVSLSYDNKAEGKSSEEIEVKTLSGALKPITNFTKERYKVFLVEGASVAEGQQVQAGFAWADQVADYLIESGSNDLLLFNRAISGAFSEEVAGRIGREIEELRDREGLNPDLVIVDTAGINHIPAAGTLLAAVRGDYSMAEFRKDVGRMINDVKSTEERTLILLNINYFSCCKSPGIDSVERNHQKRVAWNKVIRGVANAHGIILVDVEKAMIDSGKDDSYLLADGLHPSHGGHVIMANAIIDAIEKYRK